MDKKQSVTVFSNGIVDFRRVLQIQANKPVQVSIPVKKQYLGDLIDSLHVSGDGVEYETPANYSPSNDNDGSLEIPATNVIESLATKLSGAVVNITTKGSGTYSTTLLGMDAEKKEIDGAVIQTKYLIVSYMGSISRILLSDIVNIKFTDDDIQGEIDKSLRRNCQKIKPDSTFVDLTLKAAKDTEAIIRYSIPSAAWTMTYSLRAVEDGFEFQGSAVIPNKTDQDWSDVVLSVVTGEPTTFSTDIAESKIPSRQHVNVVKENAQGTVEIQDAHYASVLCAAPSSSSEMCLSPKSAKKGVFGGCMGPTGPAGAAGAMALYSRSAINHVESAAIFDEAAVREVGDFSVFTTARPMTIPSKKSALVPVFVKPIRASRSVLYYKQANHPDRPLRSVEFVNETPYPLSRGPCVVEQEGTFQGKCIIPATRAGEKCLLPHALETGVRIQSSTKRHDDQTVAVSARSGKMKIVKKAIQTTVYKMRSSKDEKFTLLLDHDITLGSHSKTSLSLRVKEASSKEWTPQNCTMQDLKGHVRISLSVPEKSELELEVKEVNRLSQEYYMNGSTWRSYLGYVGDGTPSEEVKKAFKECEVIEQKVESAMSLKDQQFQRSQKKKERQNRLISMVKTSSSGEQQNQWMKEMADLEKEITTLDEVDIPASDALLEKLSQELEATLANVSSEWSVEEAK